jgi:hypothetical protein
MVSAIARLASVESTGRVISRVRSADSSRMRLRRVASVVGGTRGIRGRYDAGFEPVCSVDDTRVIAVAFESTVLDRAEHLKRAPARSACQLERETMEAGT